MGDPDVLDAVLPGADAVVHLGARPSVPRSLEDPVASHVANATGTLQVLEGVRRHRVGHVVVASSSSVYGQNPTLPKHEDLAPMPVSPYAVQKLATEAYALAYGASLRPRRPGLPVLQRVRPAAGGRPRLRRGGAGLRGRRPGRASPSPSTATAARPATSPTSAPSATSWPTAVTGRVTHAAAGEPGLRGPLVAARGARPCSRGSSGHPIERAHIDPRAGDVRDSQADQTRLRSLFPDLVPVGLEDGLARTVDWFRTGAVT